MGVLVLVELEALEVAVLVPAVPLPTSSSAPTVETVVQPTACLTVLVARRRSVWTSPRASAAPAPSPNAETTLRRLVKSSRRKFASRLTRLLVSTQTSQPRALSEVATVPTNSVALLKPKGAVLPKVSR